ncbi:unnamed protein product [Adineta steineri]|uniref:beta-glucosidase n=1 Tax=Adineta steineri TaxID=433720 RepID=A0A814ID56_9BILA|nr:unnamed protein product [Adineta steineri]
MGRAYTEGLQGDNLTSNEHVGACLKCYVGYGLPLSGQDRTPAWISDRHMLEYFLPPFEESVRAGAVSVMVSSGEVNGIPGHANYHLLTEVLKGTYQFEGFTVSDWEDIKRLNYRDHVAETQKEAVRQAIMAGIDMSMVPLDYSFYNLTLECIKDGSIPQTRLDDAVRRILRVKFALGLFDGRTAWPNSSAINDFNKPEYYATQLQAARQVITLLKNDGNILPFDINKITETNKLLITGPTSNVLSSLNGGWSYTWQGNEQGIFPQNLTNKTILESFRARLGSTKIDYYNVSSFDQLFNIDNLLNASRTASYILVCLGEQSYTETPGNINDLTLDNAQLELVEIIKNYTQVPIIVALAQGRPRLIRRIVDLSSAIIMMFLPRTASYILVCLGEQSYTETPGNINDLTLDNAQLELVEIIKNYTQVPIIVALAQGRPRLIRRIVDLSSAIIMMFLPGTEGGQALVDVLMGDYNPSGRLPITYPKYNHRLSTYDYKWCEVLLDNTIDVEFEFGHGLSYTTFVYSNLNVSSTIKWNDQINITLNVRNNGSRQGDHTVLLFISDIYRSITPPNKELKGYTKLSLDPSEQRQIQFILNQTDLSFIGLNLTRQTEPGLFIVTVGNLQANFTLLADDIHSD